MTEPLADPLWRNATDLCCDLQRGTIAATTLWKCLRAYQALNLRLNALVDMMPQGKPWPWLQPQMRYPLPSAAATRTANGTQGCRRGQRFYTSWGYPGFSERRNKG